MESRLAKWWSVIYSAMFNPLNVPKNISYHGHKSSYEGFSSIHFRPKYHSAFLDPALFALDFLFFFSTYLFLCEQGSSVATVFLPQHPSQCPPPLPFSHILRSPALLASSIPFAEPGCHSWTPWKVNSNSCFNSHLRVLAKNPNDRRCTRYSLC